ncbi:hypothetical protein ES703_43629 [subsurface metagenome]
MYIGTLYPFFGQLTKLPGPLIEADQLMIFGWLIFVIIAGFRLDVIQNVRMNYRRANQFTHKRISGDFFLERNKVTDFENMPAVSLGHCDVVTFIEKTEPDTSRIRQFPQRVNPP